MDIESIKAGLLRKTEVETIKPSDLLSSGSTLLNLAATGRIDGCFLKGHYFFYCGDTDSGKTFIGLTCFAEASINKAFDNYRFIYDAPEGGALMDIEKFFGKRVAERLESPSEKGASETVEEMYFNIDDALKAETDTHRRSMPVNMAA